MARAARPACPAREDPPTSDQTIAIVGAGHSGLASARVLADAGAHVTLNGKARTDSNRAVHRQLVLCFCRVAGCPAARSRVDSAAWTS